MTTSGQNTLKTLKKMVEIPHFLIYYQKSHHGTISWLGVIISLLYGIQYG
jgi:hypothetical protein